MNIYTYVPKLLKKANEDPAVLEDVFELTRVLEKQGSYTVSEKGKVGATLIYDDEAFASAHEFASIERQMVAGYVRKGIGGERMVQLLKKLLLFDAKYDFDCYCRYIEWDREKEKKFYVPRRKQLLPVVKELQRLEVGDLDLLAISLPPGVGKTTIAIFYVCWISGRSPDMQTLIGSHNNEFLRGVYDECLRVMDKEGEYLWHDVFPDVPVSGTNAKDMRIDLGNKSRFQTIELTSLKSGNAGKVRATKLLYCDDLVQGIEQAMSKEQMDKLWSQYTVDLRQRKQGEKVKELHIATRWSISDVIGRLELLYGDSDRAKFINIPALDEDGNSNFDYPYGLGFSREMYEDLKESMDDASWKALYMGTPIERSGQLYPVDELRRYLTLPDGDPDAILAACDTKLAGADYCVLVIIYKYGQDWYVEDVVCENYNSSVIEPTLAKKLVKHNVQIARFESNAAGGKVAESVQKMITDMGGNCTIRTKYNVANKESRIIANEPAVKKHCLFRTDSILKGNEWREYRVMLQFLTTYTLIGRNKHDDVPDAFAQLADFMQQLHGNRVTILDRFF